MLQKGSEVMINWPGSTAHCAGGVVTNVARGSKFNTHIYVVYVKVLRSSLNLTARRLIELDSPQVPVAESRGRNWITSWQSLYNLVGWVPSDRLYLVEERY